MKQRCALCDRPMLNPAVLIGTLPVGPKCAKRAGLLELARKRVGRRIKAAGFRPRKSDLASFETAPQPLSAQRRFRWG